MLILTRNKNKNNKKTNININILMKYTQNKCIGFLSQYYPYIQILPIVLLKHRDTWLILCLFFIKEMFNFSTCQSHHKNYLELLKSSLI